MLHGDYRGEVAMRTTLQLREDSALSWARPPRYNILPSPLSLSHSTMKELVANYHMINFNTL